jgi:hypothetical protein
MALYGLDWSVSGMGQVGSLFQCDNAPSTSIKCWEAIEWLRNCWPLEKCSVTCSQLLFLFVFIASSRDPEKNGYRICQRNEYKTKIHI